MTPMQQYELRTRRNFLATSASGIGGVALASLLAQDGLLAAGSGPEAGTIRDSAHPMAPRRPHFAPKAKSCIFIFMEGAPSQLDLFDPKPKLAELHGQKMPDSMLQNVRFAFISKDKATLRGSNQKFVPRGECGMELSTLLPHIGSVADDILLVRSLHTDQFNHHPGQLMMQCGRAAFGLPCMGSWIAYGLGSESQNLPGYVVLTAGRGNSAGSTIWQSGFLPSVYSGVRFRNQGDAVLDVSNPPGLPDELQRRGLDVLRDMNARRHAEIGDPEIAGRIANYELAFRMQSAAPELIDLAGESQRTLDMYGVERKGRSLGHGGGAAAFADFSRNCLLARRMVERGVRFVNIVHASWDHHENLDQELPANAEMADQPIAALIRDLKERGLLDETLVVWGSEFGRTPLGENRSGREANTGRDHHPYAFSMFLAGGGVKGGQVHGETDELGWAPIQDPVHVNDLHATLLHLFGLDHEKLTYRFQGRDFRLTDVAGKVVPEWIA
ncbi:MAG: DUF1501 domain-containing protein [Planctomycetales bacterium]